MTNPYTAPRASLVGTAEDAENNSGEGPDTMPPAGVKGWSWGAFFLNWIWAVFNKTWVGLACFIPVVGLFFTFYLGFKGRELAWRNKRWDSLERFNRVQRLWSVWALSLVLLVALAFVYVFMISFGDRPV